MFQICRFSHVGKIVQIWPNHHMTLRKSLGREDYINTTSSKPRKPLKQGLASGSGGNLLRGWSSMQMSLGNNAHIYYFRRFKVEYVSQHSERFGGRYLLFPTQDATSTEVL